MLFSSSVFGPPISLSVTMVPLLSITKKDFYSYNGDVNVRYTFYNYYKNSPKIDYNGMKCNFLFDVFKNTDGRLKRHTFNGFYKYLI